MSKKFLALACALVLALSLAAPVFAAPITNSMSTNFAGAVADGEVAVTLVYGTTKLYVNPYGIPYAAGFGEVKAGGAAAVFAKATDVAIAEAAVTDSLFSDTAVIRNDGEVALDVSASLISTPTANVAVVADATAADGTDHSVYGKLEVAPATAGTGTAKVTTTAAGANPATDPAVKSDVTGVTIITPNWASTDKKSIPLPTVGKGTTASAASAAADAGTLPAKQVLVDSDTGAKTEVPGYLAYRVVGTAVPKTSTAWETTDLVSVSVAFTFAPHVDTPAAGG